ncbi:MAG: hypothetical protein QM763_23700 [Agriterribacter sp.]
MRNMYGGKWISMLGIPPLTLIFLPLVFVTMFRHRLDVARRKRRLANDTAANGKWIKSWF